MQQLPTHERASMAGLIAVAMAMAAGSLATRPSEPPDPPMCPLQASRPLCAGSVDVLIATRQFSMAAFVLELQRRAACAVAARELALVYHVAMAPDSDAMEAFAAAQQAIRIDRLFGHRLTELHARRAAVAAAAARAYQGRALDDWAREARTFAAP